MIIPFEKKKIIFILSAIIFVLAGTFIFLYFNITIALADGYYKKGLAVYYKDSRLEKADKNTFEILGIGFARDKNFVYYKGFEFGFSNSQTFRILSDKYAADRAYGYVYNNEKIMRLPNSNGQTMEILERDGYAKDENKHYFFDGTDFYAMENKGFEFIDNNENYDARDENHYYLKGKKVRRSEEFENNLESIRDKLAQEEGKKEKEEEKKQQNIEELKKLKINSKPGKTVNLESITTQQRDIINRVFESCIKKETHPRLLLDYKIFEVIESPFVSNQYFILYGLDKEKSTNNCCDNSTGYFIVDNGVLSDIGKYYRVGGDYDFGGKHLTYFDYKYIDNVVWTEEGSIIYDLVMAPGNSVQFPSKYKSSSNDLDLLFDMVKAEVYTNTKDDLMIKETVVKGKKETECDPIARYKTINKYPSPSKKFTAVTLGVVDDRAWGIYLTDGDKIIKSFFEGSFCTECGFIHEIKDVIWESERKLKFNILSVSEEGETVEEKIIDF